MNKKKSFLLIISLVAYIIGISFSLALNTFVLWANLEGQSFWGYPEALTYNSELTTEARLARLNCPVILTPGETGTINVRVRNPQDAPIEAWISAHISRPGETENMIREMRGVPLAPRESATLSWEVTQENVVNDRMVLARVFLRLTERHPPARTKHCGIMTVDLWNLSSQSILMISLGGGHLLQVGGIGLWSWGQQLGKQKRLTRNVLIAASLLSLAMTWGTFSHNWILSLISLMLGLLIVFTSISYSLGITDRAN